MTELGRNEGQIDLKPLIERKKKNPKYKICLNMIVKNESNVIVRLIHSVKDVIDYYIISDTGSDDNTIALIKRTMKRLKIPGEIHQNPWKNFAHNRQVAMEYAYENPDVKYILTIDADEELTLGTQIKTNKELKLKYFDKYDKHCYHIKKKYMGNNYYVPFLLDTTRVDWHWKGVVHNFVDIKEHYGVAEHEYIPEELVYNHVNYHEGSKSHGVSSKEKYMRDVKLLTAEVEKNPDDTRSWFYLGQSYYDAGEFEDAYGAYKKRAQMGGWKEEVFYSMYRMGVCAILCKKSWAVILDHMLAAYEFHPMRAEPLYELCKYCRENKFYNQGYLFGKWALTIQPANDVLFIHSNVYEYSLLDQFSLCAYWTGHYEESRDCLMKILHEKKYPPEYEERYKENLKWSLNKIQERKNEP